MYKYTLIFLLGIFGLMLPPSTFAQYPFQFELEQMSPVDLKNTEGSIGVQDFSASITIPLYDSESLKLYLFPAKSFKTVTYDGLSSGIIFDGLGRSLRKEDLIENFYAQELVFGFEIHFSGDDVLTQLKYMTAADHENLPDDEAFYVVQVIYTQTNKEPSKPKYGLFYSNQFGDNFIFPLVGIRYDSPDELLHFYTIFPSFAIFNYQVYKKIFLLAEIKRQGSSYSITDSEVWDDAILCTTAIKTRLGTGIMRFPPNKLKISFGMCYISHRQFDFLDISQKDGEEKIVEFRLPDQTYLSLSLRLTM